MSSGEVLTVANREVTVARVSSDTERKVRERPVIISHLQLEDVSQSDKLTKFSSLYIEIV